MKIFAIIASAFLFTSAAFADTNCTGYDTVNNDYIYGTCSNESFSGYDSETGAYVYGNCQNGESFQGWNSQNQDNVYGSCN